MKADATGIQIRRMREADLDQVMALAARLKDAPHWARVAYVSALDAGATPRRIGLVAEDAVGETEDLKGHGFSRAASQPEDLTALAAEGMQAEDAFPQGLKPPFLPARRMAQLKPRPFKAGAPVSVPGNGRVVGLLIASVIPPQAELESIAVSEAAQRQGVGRRLILALVGELKAAGAHEVFLEVRASNQRALEFYRSMGWVESGRRSRYYADPEEDAVLMNLGLG